MLKLRRTLWCNLVQTTIEHLFLKRISFLHFAAAVSQFSAILFLTLVRFCVEIIPSYNNSDLIVLRCKSKFNLMPFAEESAFVLYIGLGC